MTTPFDVRHCPRCGVELESRDDHGHARPTCPSCGYIHYWNPVPAAGVILERDGAVLMVKRRWDPRAGQWCLPAGFMEYGEAPEKCAVRELFEETGVIGRLTGLFGVYAGLDDPRVRTVLILYTAEVEGGEEQAGDDATALRWFERDALPHDSAFASHRQALAEYWGAPPMMPAWRRRHA